MTNNELYILNTIIADFIIKAELICPLDCFQQNDVQDKKPDIFISINKEDIMFEKSISDYNPSRYTCEWRMLSRKIAESLPLHNAFLLHSALIDVDGVGVAFAAHSGTGKTTHMLLWQKLLGERLTIVNGDKPIIRFFDDEPNTPYAYGNPWNGKENLGCNMRTPLKHICFIERSETNSVEHIEKADAIDRIFNQVYMPKDSMVLMNTISLIDRLLSSCTLWKIKCNMEDDAAKVAFEGIFEQQQ